MDTLITGELIYSLFGLLGAITVCFNRFILDLLYLEEIRTREK